MFNKNYNQDFEFDAYHFPMNEMYWDHEFHWKWLSFKMSVYAILIKIQIQLASEISCLTKMRALTFVE